MASGNPNILPFSKTSSLNVNDSQKASIQSEIIFLSMAVVAVELSVRDYALRCLDGFEELREELELNIERQIVEEQRARFRLWAANIGVFLDSNAALDSRLKTAPVLSDAIKHVLEAILQNLELCMRTVGELSISRSSCTTGKTSPKQHEVSDDLVVSKSKIRHLHSSRSTLPADLESEQYLKKSDTASWISQSSSSEESEVMPNESRSILKTIQALVGDNIHTLITQLHYLSRAIRESSKLKRDQRGFNYISQNPAARQAAAELEHYARFYIMRHFPHIPNEHAERLCETIVMRWRRLCYQKDHDEKTYGAAHPQMDLLQIHRDQERKVEPSPSQILPMVRTGEVSQASVNVPQPLQHPATLSPTNPSTIDQRKALANVSRDARPGPKSVVQNNQLDFPKPPKPKDGMADVICHYCRNIIQISEMSDSHWRKHIMNDLDPYVCVRPNCTETPEMFGSVEEWLRHMTLPHTEVYFCSALVHAAKESRSFPSEEEYRDHMHRCHPGEFSDDQLDALTRMALRSDDRTLMECPFQDDFHFDSASEDNDANFASVALQDHVVGHLKELALLSLPAVDLHGSEDSNTDSRANSNSVQADISSRKGEWKGHMNESQGDWEDYYRSSDDDSPFPTPKKRVPTLLEDTKAREAPPVDVGGSWNFLQDQRKDLTAIGQDMTERDLHLLESHLHSDLMKKLSRSEDPKKIFICESDIVSLWSPSRGISPLEALAAFKGWPMDLLKSRIDVLKILSLLIYAQRDEGEGETPSNVSVPISLGSQLPLKWDDDSELELTHPEMLKRLMHDQYLFCPLVLANEGLSVSHWGSEMRLPFLESKDLGRSVFGHYSFERVAAGQLRLPNGSSNNEAKWVTCKRVESTETGVENEIRIQKLLRLNSRSTKLALMLSIATVSIGSDTLFFYEPATYHLADILDGTCRGRGIRFLLPELTPIKILNQARNLAGAIDFLHRGLEDTTGKQVFCAHMCITPYRVAVQDTGTDEAGPKLHWKLTGFECAVANDDFADIAVRDHLSDYRSPESSSVSQVNSPACDMWSYGCILALISAFMVAGPDGVRRLNGDRQADADAFFSKVVHITTFLSSLDSDISWFHQLNALVRSLLHINPERRPSSADVESELEEIQMMSPPKDSLINGSAPSWMISWTDTIAPNSPADIGAAEQSRRAVPIDTDFPTTGPVKLSVGIDYGTTFSGIAFVTSQRSDVKDVEVISHWPNCAGATRYVEKVPSQIAYAFENTGYPLEDDKWGYGVESYMRSVSWTKLLLEPSTSANDYENSFLREAAGDSGLRLPPGKTAIDVVADYLSFLYKHCMDLIERKLGRDLLNITPIDFWFTMPAIWSDAAQHATKTAALRAGFGTRVRDAVNMITEPEAAVLAVFKTMKDKFDDLLLPNTGVLVCDCGGGTVDINTYTIVTSGDRLLLKEACVGVGGKCGSTFVDRNFYDLLTRRYGSSFTSLPRSKRGPGSRFMTEFEVEKRNFDISTSRNSYLMLIMRDITKGDWNWVQYDPDEGEVEVTYEDMKSCFDPVVGKIVEMIANQVQAVLANGSPRVENVILVGGFASSGYLWRRVKEWCYENGGIRLLSPDRPWSAIARGAALRGLEGTIIGSKRCRRSYGTSISRPFQDGIDPLHDMWTHPIEGSRHRSGWMQWHIRKGEEMYPKTKKSLVMHETFKRGEKKSKRLHLYASASDQPPVRKEEGDVQLVGTIRIDLDDVDLESFQKKRTGYLGRGETYYDVKYSLEIMMGDESGLLKFTVICKGQECGSASIDFATT